MVTMRTERYTLSGTEHTIYSGDSADTKPLDAKNGDRFEEIDTGDRYIFSESAKKWYKDTAGSGDGGGGEGYHFASDAEVDEVLDKYFPN